MIQTYSRYSTVSPGTGRDCRCLKWITSALTTLLYSIIIKAYKGNSRCSQFNWFIALTDTLTWCCSLRVIESLWPELVNIQDGTVTFQSMLQNNAGWFTVDNAAAVVFHFLLLNSFFYFICNFQKCVHSVTEYAN